MGHDVVFIFCSSPPLLSLLLVCGQSQVMYSVTINTQLLPPTRGQRVQGAPGLRLRPGRAQWTLGVGRWEVLSEARCGAQWLGIFLPSASPACCIMNGFHNVAAAQKGVFAIHSLTGLSFLEFYQLHGRWGAYVCIIRTHSGAELVGSKTLWSYLNGASCF